MWLWHLVRTPVHSPVATVRLSLILPQKCQRKIVVYGLILATKIGKSSSVMYVKQNVTEKRNPLYLTKFIQQEFVLQANLSWIFPSQDSAGSREELRFCQIDMEHILSAFGVKKTCLIFSISYVNKNKRVWHFKAEYLLLWYIFETRGFVSQVWLILAIICTFTETIQAVAINNQFLPRLQLIIKSSHRKRSSKCIWRYTIILHKSHMKYVEQIVRISTYSHDT
jgi:hypothetical protein